MTTTEWVYLTFHNGRLRDDEGFLFVNKTFASEDEANDWLEAEDIRATIR